MLSFLLGKYSRIEWQDCIGGTCLIFKETAIVLYDGFRSSTSSATLAMVKCPNFSLSNGCLVCYKVYRGTLNILEVYLNQVNLN